MSNDILDIPLPGEIKIEVPQNKLVKGEDVNITAKDPTMKNVMVGVGWDLLITEANPLDLDISCFLLNRDDKTRVDSDFVFYNNMEGCNGAVVHDGDSRTGAGDGDNETISISLNDLPFDVVRIVFVISIYRGDEKEQSLSKLRNSYIRLINKDNLQEMARYDLAPEIEGVKETAMLAACLSREGPKWHFKALGEFTAGGLGKVASNFDIIVQAS
jgi:tellurium resistance protein TerD